MVDSIVSYVIAQWSIIKPKGIRQESLAMMMLSSSWRKNRKRSKIFLLQWSFCEDLLVLVLVSNQVLGTGGPEDCSQATISQVENIIHTWDHICVRHTPHSEVDLDSRGQY
jgi:hypothetical protein